MNQVKHDEIRQHVRNRYKQIAMQGASEEGCCGPSSGCCDTHSEANAVSSVLGYSDAELGDVPSGANLGLGCGNPQAIASLRGGEVVLDLGSGGGFDCFLASRQVGETGQVIGVDMTPEMISRARSNAANGSYRNTEFRLGEIEHLPVADNSVDVIISNCVINLSPNKPQVFNEAYRVLRPGGRLAISDVVATATMPEEWKSDPESLSACISGASTVDEMEQMLRAAGFRDIRIQPKDESRSFIKEWVPGASIDDYIVSATIQALK
ncbi:arsenite methyltransferase [Cohnella panacarvi]|uniref:arsenite methyltransferase n=1 Tax=Cohnella panacarvi TaxID=400776 RepID=UPI00047C34E6|nr:arsenite methyltransferase [Cohnella panacarvi]